MNAGLTFTMIVSAPVAGYALRLALETGRLPPLDELAALALLTAAGVWLWRWFRDRGA